MFLVDVVELPTQVNAGMFKVVWPVAVRDHVLPKPDPGFEFGAQHVAFVQEQDEIRLREEWVRDDRFPEQDGILL